MHIPAIYAGAVGRNFFQGDHLRAGGRVEMEWNAVGEAIG
jgi:hypothetical protein